MAAMPVDRTMNHAVALTLGIAAQFLSPALEPYAPAFLAALCLACLLDLARPRWRDAVTAAALALLALFGHQRHVAAQGHRHQRWAGQIHLRHLR